MKPKVSIIISSFNRKELLRRTLYAITTRPPGVPFEVVLVDDNSTEDILGELRNFSASLAWKFIRFDGEAFTKVTGLKKFLNNPCVTNNIGFRHAEGSLIFQQGNEVIIFGDCYNKMLAEYETNLLLVATTYDVNQILLEELDEYGSNLNEAFVRSTYPWPLQSKHYRSDVTNYVSLSSRNIWENLGGYDERYYGGISAEDSDFVRRARKLGVQVEVSDAVTLHQSHGGMTCYTDPPTSYCTKQRWAEGVALNRAYYDNWDGSYKNAQRWEFGTIGVKEVIKNT